MGDDLEIKMDDNELVGAQWMPFSAYLAQPHWKDKAVYTHLNELIVAYRSGEYAGLDSLKTDPRACSYFTGAKDAVHQKGPKRRRVISNAGRSIVGSTARALSFFRRFARG